MPTLDMNIKFELHKSFLCYFSNLFPFYIEKLRIWKCIKSQIILIIFFFSCLMANQTESVRFLSTFWYQNGALEKGARKRKERGKKMKKENKNKQVQPHYIFKFYLDCKLRIKSSYSLPSTPSITSKKRIETPLLSSLVFHDSSRV